MPRFTKMEFPGLYKEFIDSGYLGTLEGMRHIDAYDPVDNLIGELRKLNRRIDDRHYEVGITFFLHEGLEDKLEDIWRMEIVPYLEEYFFDRPAVVDEYHWERIGGALNP
jgi:hypothetical protein